MPVSEIRHLLIHLLVISLKIIPLCLQIFFAISRVMIIALGLVLLGNSSFFCIFGRFTGLRIHSIIGISECLPSPFSVFYILFNLFVYLTLIFFLFFIVSFLSAWLSLSALSTHHCFYTRIFFSWYFLILLLFYKEACRCTDKIMVHLNCFIEC